MYFVSCNEVMTGRYALIPLADITKVFYENDPNRPSEFINRNNEQFIAKSSFETDFPKLVHCLIDIGIND